MGGTVQTRAKRRGRGLETDGGLNKDVGLDKDGLVWPERITARCGGEIGCVPGRWPVLAVRVCWSAARDMVGCGLGTLPSAGSSTVGSVVCRQLRSERGGG